MTQFPRVPLQEVLSLAEYKVDVEPDKTYRPAGIYSFGRGLFGRSPILGSETKYSKFFLLKSDHFVLSRLKGWEGAVAVVTPEFDDMVVSQEFPTFQINKAKLDPAYLAWICRWEGFWNLLLGQSRGIGARRDRIHPEKLLKTQIPVPRLPHQKRIVDWLDDIGGRSAKAAELSRAHSPKVKVLFPALVSAILERQGAQDLRLGDLVDPISDMYNPGEDPSPAKEFVGMEHVESHTGRRTGSSPLGDERGSKKRFAPGDIVYGKLRPYLNKVWVADRHGLCSVDQTVLRPKTGVEAEAVAAGMLSSQFLAEVIDLTHRAQLPRIRLEQLLDLAVKMPLPKNQLKVQAKLNQLRDQSQRLINLQTSRLAALDAIIPSSLNHALNGDG